MTDNPDFPYEMPGDDPTPGQRTTAMRGKVCTLKDEPIITMQKKSLTYRGHTLMLSVTRWKRAGLMHTVSVYLSSAVPGALTLRYNEVDANRAAAMRRVKRLVDEHLAKNEEERLLRGIAQLDAGKGVEHELIEDDPMVEAIPDLDERAIYHEGRF